MLQDEFQAIKVVNMATATPSNVDMYRSQNQHLSHLEGSNLDSPTCIKKIQHLKYSNSPSSPSNNRFLANIGK